MTVIYERDHNGERVIGYNDGRGAA